MFGIFSKTIKHDCPDGRPAIVYKHIDDAIPLELRNSSAKFNSKGSVQDYAGADVNTEYKSTVSQILFAIDARNSSQVLDFRNAYLAYMSDPCGNRDLLARTTQRIMDDRAFLHRLQIQADTLIGLIEKSPENSTDIIRLIASIMAGLNSTPPIVAAKAIDDAKKDARDMLDGDNND